MTPRSPPGLARFNALEERGPRRAPRGVRQRGWARRLLAGRPYADRRRRCFAASDAAMAELTADGTGRGDGRASADRPAEARGPASAREQRGMAGASASSRRRCSN